ncbi:MAG TPA: hypothetical protein VL263_10190 [Vicinamibacterales bacterium]|nr:hypothetical protein [Vicinamibacterales bacterium]
MTTDDLLTIRGFGHCGIRLTIAANERLTVEGIMIDDSAIANRQSPIINRDSANRQSDNAPFINRMAQSANQRIVNKSSIVSRRSSMDADALEPD